MARYIKANPLVAEFLQVENDRNTVKDGNYLLWQADMLKFGPLTQLADTLRQIGGLSLSAHEAREEQDGTVTRPLPVATDPRFIIEPVTVPEENETGADSSENEPVGDESFEPDATLEEDAEGVETGEENAGVSNESEAGTNPPDENKEPEVTEEPEAPAEPETPEEEKTEETSNEEEALK